MSTDTTPSPRLPIEVIEQVIDSIYEQWYDGREFRQLYTTWRACALACRAMVPRSQFWLFRDTVLKTEKQALSFAEILRKNVTVAPHVDTLTLSDPEHDGWDGKGYTWISWTPLVFAPLMKNLRELRLEWDVFRDCHPGLPRALTAFKSIRRLTLFENSFASSGHCTRFIRAFPRLRYLDLYNALWKPNPPMSQRSHRRSEICRQRKRLQLAHLDLSGRDSSIRPIAKWLLEVEGTKSLVTFYGYLEHHEITKDIAFPSRSSIRDMALFSQSDYTMQIPDTSLDSLQAMHLWMGNDRVPVLLLTSIVVAASRQLRELTVYLSVQDEKTLDEPVLTENDLAAYAELDTALCKPASSGLRLTLCVYDEPERPSIEVVGWWQRNLVGRLPKFCSGEGSLVTRGMSSRFPLERWLNEREGFS